MSEGYQEDLNMYEEAAGLPHKTLDRDALLHPIHDLEYNHHPVQFPQDASLGEVLGAMTERGKGAALLLKEGKLVGIFAERDILLKRLYENADLNRPISEFMTPEPDCLTPDDSIAYGLNRMVQGGFRHVPLISPDGSPLGLLSMRHVMAYIESFFPRVVTNLPPHSEHNPPDRALYGG